MLTLLAALLSLSNVPTLTEGDRLRILEAQRLASLYRASVWPGWDRTGMPILLVTDSIEFLVSHPRPPAEFNPAGTDPQLGPIFTRKRVLPKGLQATWPNFAGSPTMIMGTAANTGVSSNGWAVTALHENFHEWQYGQPGYIEGVAALDLSGGDETGMWMLNFPFRYDSAEVRSKANALKKALLEFVNDSTDHSGRAAAACTAWKDLARIMTPAEERYLQFQFWQEGVARYAEIEVARAAAKDSSRRSVFASAADAEPYSVTHAQLERALRKELATDFGEMDRVNVYAMGAAIARILDKARPGWKEVYAKERFRFTPC